MKQWLPLIRNVSADLLTLLGALSVVPYELGKLSIVISPEWKAWCTAIGFGGAFVLKSLDKIFNAIEKYWPKQPPRRIRKKKPKRK